MKLLIYLAIIGLFVQELTAQFIQSEKFPANLKHHAVRHQPGFNFMEGMTMYKPAFVSAISDSVQKTPLLVELGYITAMEVTFAGLSYLSSRDHWAGRTVTGGADVLMGVAGIGNAFAQDATLNQLGYFALSAGFFAKALYNFGVFGEYSTKERFNTNFIGYNILVFSGYYLDSL